MSKEPCFILGEDPREPYLDEVYAAVRADRLKHALSAMLALLALATNAGIRGLQRTGAMAWWVIALAAATLALVSTLPLVQCRLGVLFAGPAWVVTGALVLMWGLSSGLYATVLSLSWRLA